MKAWAKEFYNSEAWHSCRAAYLSSKGYLCERCARSGKIEPAKIAHHKVYLTELNITDPAIALSFDNLEALCQDCHNAEHHHAETRYKFDDEGNILPP